MRKTMMRAGIAGLAAAGLVGQAWAGCVAPTDMAALRTAAMQQELMVAAFSCHDVARYNQFVRAHQPELIQSDARLKAYFVQRDGAKGEASYHSYKTELANASSLRSVNGAGFCDGADADFDVAAGSLLDAEAAHPWLIEDVYQACREDDGATLLAASAEIPERTMLHAVDALSVALEAPRPHRALEP